MTGNHQVRFGGRPCGKGPAQQAPRRAADPTGRLMQYRRLARDHEALPARSEAMAHIAMIGLMTRRLTGESTPTGAGPDRRKQERNAQ